MEQKTKDKIVTLCDVEGSLRRISGVLDMVSYAGESVSVIDPNSLTHTICMLRDALDQQIEALCSIQFGQKGGYLA